MKTAIATVCALLLLLAGCSDESDCPTCPSGGKIRVPIPTLQNIWPNADKTAWTYQQDVRVWEGNVTLYPSRDDIPDVPLPDWSDIFDLVESPTPVEPNTATRRIYRMQFDGVTTTTSGVTAQRLNEEVFTEATQGVQPRAVTHRMPIFRRLPATQRDPRTRILRSAGPITVRGTNSDASGELSLLANRTDVWQDVPRGNAQVLSMPNLIHGGAWEKTSEWIGTYGDLSARLAWKFLADDIS
ncbi:MAG: hypothetical protein P8181_01815, partial [bacterium]